MYYSAIGLLATLILLIENQDILLHRSDGFDKPAWNAYRQFLAGVLVYYITDMLWGVLESGKFVQLLFIDTSVYFVAMAVSVALWTRYIVTYLDQHGPFELVLRNAGRAIAVAATIATVANIFFPVIFIIDDACVYQPLGIRYIILVSQIVLLFLVTGYALSSLLRRGNTEEKRRRYRTLALFGLIVGLCLIAQLLYPYLPLYAIGYLLGTCLLRAFIIGDEKELYRLELEEATKVAERRQSITSLLDNMPALSYSKDVMTGAYLACNQSFADYANKKTPAGVVGSTDFELFDEATANHFVEDDKKALAMDRPHVFFEDVVDAGGKPRQFQTTKLRFYDSSGRECLLGMSMDVTEAEQAKAAYQRALHESNVYESIVDALSGDYFNLFYVDLETNDYIEYGMRTEAGFQMTEKRGEDFFEASRANAADLVYEGDLEQFVASMDKDTLLGEVDKNGMYIMQYRLMIDGVPTYVNLKATRAVGDDRHLIIGVNNVDAQVRDRAAALQAMQEQKSYQRLSALNGNLIVLYYVDLETDYYTEFGSTKSFDELGIAKQGDDFFRKTYENGMMVVYADDLKLFRAQVTKDNILHTIERDGMFALDYRLMIDGRPTYVRLKAARYTEDGKEMLIVGLLDEDAQVQREQAIIHDLSVAKRMASVDALTGVKNKHAYTQWEEQINSRIESGSQEPFAVVVCDLNGLKDVNDQQGHKEGDACIKKACQRICDTFVHSPVFRVGGDEFVVLLMGEDYDKRMELVERVNELPKDPASIRPGETISAGMVVYDVEKHTSLLSVFEAADMAMYQRKEYVKGLT